MKKLFFIIFISIIVLYNHSYLFSQSTWSNEKEKTSIADLQDMSIQDLMNIKVVTGTTTDVKLQELPSTIIVITEKDIRKHRYRYLVEVLDDLPGFDISFMQGLYGSIYRQRGLDQSENNRILIFINGVQDNLISAGSAYIKHKYALYNVKRIEILYGPASSLYGANAFTGVINIITKNGEDIQNYIEYGIGSYSFDPLTGRAGPFANFTLGHKFGEKKDDFSFIISGHWINSKGPILNQRDNEDPFESNYWFSDQYTGSALNHNYMIDFKMSWKDTTIGIFQSRDYTGQSVFGSGAWYADNSELAFWNTLTSTIYLKNKYVYDKFITNNIQLVYRRIDQIGTDTEYYDSDGDSIYDSASFSWYYKPDREFSVDDNINIKWNASGHAVKTTFGISASFQEAWNYNKSSKSYDDLNFSTPQEVQNHILSQSFPEKPEEDADNKYNYNDLALYLENYFGINEYFNLTIGYRYDIFTLKGLKVEYKGPTDKYGTDDPAYISDTDGYANGYIKVKSDSQWYSLSDTNQKWTTHNPKVGLLFSPMDEYTLKLLYGEAFRAPTVREFVSISGSRITNPDLKPEKIRTFEINSIYFPIPNIRTEISLFRSYVYNMINLGNTLWLKKGVDGSYLDQFQNSGDVEVTGFDFSLKVELRKNLDIYGSYSFQRSIFVKIYDAYMEDTILSHDGDKMPRVSDHKFKFGITLLLLEHLNLDLRGSYIGERPNLRSNPIESTPGYFIFNGSIGSKDWPYKNMDITFKVNNILNSELHDTGYRSAEGDYYPSALPLPGIYYSLELSHKLGAI